MEIIAFEPGLAPDLARCYNELVASVPYHRPVPEGWFVDLRASCFQDCLEQAVLVAREGGEVVGFVHVGVSAPPTHEWHLTGEPGAIRFLSYRLGERPVGAALLEAAERWLQERDRSEIWALVSAYMYPFYPLQLAHISERVSHLPPLLGMAGYENPETEVFFDWPDFVPPPVPRPALGFDLVREEAQLRTGHHISLLAMQAGQQIGVCKMTLLRDPWRPQLADWCDCNLLSIAEPFQGQRLGKYLLASGLAAMREIGARHAMISTDWNNYRAYLFYTNFGYRFLDRTFGFRRRVN